MTFIEALQREMNFLKGGIQMPSAGLKVIPTKVTVSVTEGYSAEFDGYGGLLRYSPAAPKTFSGTGESVGGAVKALRSSVEATLSKNKDKEILSLLDRLDKAL